LTPPTPTRREETAVFLLLAIVLAPVLAIAIVGGYGIAIWMYQLLSGPPLG
jgi:nitrate reductase NapE